MQQFYYLPINENKQFHRQSVDSNLQSANLISASSFFIFFLTDFDKYIIIA